MLVSVIVVKPWYRAPLYTATVALYSWKNKHSLCNFKGNPPGKTPHHHHIAIQIYH
jgi:hypothetical protein